MKPLPLHDYQIKAKDFIKTHPYCALYLDMGMGKAVDNNLVIPTPNGSKRVGDIKEGDYIFGSDGLPTKVLKVYPHKNKKAYEVRLLDGRSYICCDEHLTPYVENNCIKNKPLGDMIDDYKYIDDNMQKSYKYKLPVLTEPLYFDANDHLISSYLLGVLLGSESYIVNNTLVLKDIPDVVYDTLKKQYAKLLLMHNVFVGYDIQHDHKHTVMICDKEHGLQTTNIKTLIDELEHLSLDINDKSNYFIPDEYMYDSSFNRASLLKGILSCSSSIVINNMGKYHIMFNSKSTELVADVIDLCHSLGCVTFKNFDVLTEEWSVSIYLNYNIENYIVNEDMFALNIEPEQYTSIPIISITETTPRDMTCFTVDASDHLFLINDCIVTHNTLTTLSALLELKPQGHILVIAPKTIARATWLDEIHDWEIPVRTESFLVNEKGKSLPKAKRLEKYDAIYDTPPSMYFINRELVPDLVKYITSHKLPWPFPTVVIDEMQSFKSPKSERFKCLKKMRPYITRLIGLSGTPAPNGLLDLWSQIYLLDMGMRLGGTQTAYKDMFFDVTQKCNGYPVAWKPKEYIATNNPAMPYVDAETFIYNQIGDICLSMKNTELTLPELIMEDVYVTMDEAEKKLYKQLKKDSIIEFADDTAAVAVNAAVLSAKLLQLASGTLYTDDLTEVNGYRAYKEIHTKKIDICNYIINNTNSPVLIAYHFKCDAKRLLESIDGAVLFDKTPQMIHDWNAGKIKVLLIQPASAGHGLNLQKGTGHTLIWFTIPWSLEEYQQTNARLYRQGQQNNVTIYRLFTKGTIDTKVARAINNKAMTQNALLEAIEAEIDEK